MRAWNYLKNTDLIELEIESYVLVFLLRLTVGSPRDLFLPCIFRHMVFGMFKATQPGSQIHLYLVFFAIARN